MSGTTSGTGLETQEFTSPGRSRGFRDAIRNRYLLKLLVRKEIQVRYRGSILGILWSYIKPGVQFLVFFIAMGQFLGLGRTQENYAIYLFSGIVVINFFSEAFGNGARSIVVNGGLIKKIYLPRQLFPLSTVWVALVHFLPQFLILLAACLLVGWNPTLLSLAAIPLGLLIIGMFSAGLGMIFAAANVFFRDSENIVDMLIMVATWSSPVLYLWPMVRDALPGWAFALYSANPLTVAVELYHYGFWRPTTSGFDDLPHLFSVYAPIALAISAALLWAGDALFRKMEGSFAQEL